MKQNEEVGSIIQTEALGLQKECFLPLNLQSRREASCLAF